MLSLSTMWAKNRFNCMGEFVAKAKELGFTSIEPNSVISPPMLLELIDARAFISSIHAPCPVTLSSQGTPITALSVSSLDKDERKEAVYFAKRTIDLASEVGAKAIVLHMGEVPIDLNLQDTLYRLYNRSGTNAKEYNLVKEELMQQRRAQALPYLQAAMKSLLELTDYGEKKGIMLGLETRFHFHEIPTLEEMTELLREVRGSLTGYWHDVGHAQMQQKLGFARHEEWLSCFQDRMVGIHLHDVKGVTDHYPPGEGEIDWGTVAKYLFPEVIKVCEIGEWNEEEELRGVTEFLQMKGIASS